MIDRDPESTSLAAEFRARTGTAPAGIWAAPGRINLIGEHTDYNDGFVLPAALDRRVSVAARASPGRSRVWSRQEPGRAEFAAATVGPGDVTGWAAYVAGVTWALRAAGYAVGDADLLVDSDVPAGAGLSSSAALGCAVAIALLDLAGLGPVTAAGPNRTAVALLVRTAENDFVGAPTGVMDQLASMHGRAGHLVFIDTRSLQVEHLALDLAGHGLALLVVDTRTPHRLLDGKYARRRRSCTEAAAALGVAALRDATTADVARLPAGVLQRRARHVVSENDRVRLVADLLRVGADPRRIGPALTASHQSLRDDFEVTVDQLDIAVDAALAAGAHGARMTGGGFGGCVLALVDRSAVATVTAAVTGAFERRGFEPPHCFPATASAGAGRIG